MFCSLKACYLKFFDYFCLSDNYRRKDSNSLLLRLAFSSHLISFEPSCVFICFSDCGVRFCQSPAFRSNPSLTDRINTICGVRTDGFSSPPI